MEAREPLVEEFFLGELNLEAVYFVWPCSAMAIQPDIPDAAKLARRAEAHGYHLKPPSTGERECYVVDSFDGLDEVSLAATKRGLLACITDEEIADIRAAYEESEKPDEWWISLQCQQHLHVVIAVLEYLEAIGELPSHPDWGA